MADDVHHLEEDLRAIRIDDGPRFVPLRLDKMFMRATTWKSNSSSTSAPIRLPSPTRHYVPISPLPQDLKPGQHVSPLGGVFQYPELIPLVLDYFERPNELAVLARVCKEFARIARKKLYQDIWVRPWEDAPKTKLIALFDTLQSNPDLCRLVRKLDIRFFPLDMGSDKRYELEEAMQKSLSAMQNLERVVWTRDKSLSPILVETIASLPRLRHLELSGHSYRYFDAHVLSSMPKLEDLRIMMPDSTFRDALRPLISALADRPLGGLRGLAIICRSSPLIDDKLLADLAPSLTSLRRLQLIGCVRVTREGVFNLLRETRNLEELSIDALPHSDLHDLSSAPCLSSLHTLSLTFTAPGKEVLDISEIPRLPKLPSLRALDLTLSNAKRYLPPNCFFSLAEQVDLSRLNRISMLNLVIGTEVLDHLLSLARSDRVLPSNSISSPFKYSDIELDIESKASPSPALKELYISVNGKRIVLESQMLDHADHLEVLHINAPEPWGPRSEDLREIAKRAKGLDQVGALNRVYEVHRRWKRSQVFTGGNKGKGIRENGVGDEKEAKGEMGVEVDGESNAGQVQSEKGKDKIANIKEEMKFDEDEEIGEHVVELSRWSRINIPNYFQIWRA